MGEIITFYSYKGGVGRTMALANVAVLLAQWKYKVLVVDWDIEAPGLEYYFKEYVKLSNVHKKKGVVDLLKDIENISSYDKRALNKCITKVRIPDAVYRLHLLTAGIRDDEYFGRVQNMDIDNIYNNKDGGENIESLRKKWKSYYDFILIDSRTGVTDFGGICTVQLPDMLVLFFGANEQSLDGAIKVARRILSARQDIPIERLLLTILPVASRFDSQEEFKISQEWLDTFAESLQDFYADWLPANIEVHDIVEMTKIPYIPYFSFGEKLPVIEQGTNDPTSIGYAYENLSALIANKLEQVELFTNNRDEYISRVSGEYEKGLFTEKIVNKRVVDSRQYREAYLDIETTGLSSMDGEIIVVGVYLVGDDESKVIQIIGEDINKEELLGALRSVGAIYTYNGSRFDIPFIKSSIGIDIEKEFRHIDLMYACWRRSLYGGLKAVEAQLGIPRRKGISGYDAIRLWREYTSNQNDEALAALLESNREDVTNLKLLRDKLMHLQDASISLDNEMGIVPLVGIEADHIDVTSYVNQLRNRDRSQDIKRIYRLTKSEFDSLLADTIDNLHKVIVPEKVKVEDIIVEAGKLISGFDALTSNVEKFALASVQENYIGGVNIILKFAGDWISISEKPSIRMRTRFLKGSLALLAWRMLCLSGAKALEEEEFEALRIILSEPIEVEEEGRGFTNLSLIQRQELFYPESLLGHADLAVSYISKLWNDELHLHSYFVSDEAYNFAIAKFFILVALVSPRDEYTRGLYPGYRLLPQARRAMSSFCSRLGASDTYLNNIANAVGESSATFRNLWSQRVDFLNRIALGSSHFLVDEVHFPDRIGDNIPD